MAAGRITVNSAPLSLKSSPLLAGLRRTGTEHEYADTGDRDELRALSSVVSGALVAEVDGNTVNQPLVHRVLDRSVDDGLVAVASDLQQIQPESRRHTVVPFLYAIVSARIGNDVAALSGAGRAREASLQLHMGAARQPELSRRLARVLRRAMPSCLVKVPFAPDAPQCVLIARDLEREGIPVNFTSTFSARQVVAAALLADVTRTNIFMGA